MGDRILKDKKPLLQTVRMMRYESEQSGLDSDIVTFFFFTIFTIIYFYDNTFSLTSRKEWWF